MASLLIDGEKLPITVKPGRGRITYRLTVPVPAVEDPVPTRIELRHQSRAWQSTVHVDVPECLRHRYADGALCMWFQADPISNRWEFRDGIPALVDHIRRHLFQEACCRAGQDWPGEEAPGEHYRPERCRTCGGEGP